VGLSTCVSEYLWGYADLHHLHGVTCEV
jgi:hypothetical protein